MNRGVLMLLGAGCTATTPEPPNTASEAAASEAAVNEVSASEVSAKTPPRSQAEVEAMALRCEGSALRDLGSAAITALEPTSEHPSARLLAIWERDRRFEGAFEEALTAELGVAATAWWVDVLRSGRGGEGNATFYALQVTPNGDRRGPLEVGPGGVRVRENVGLAESDGALAYDLSMGRVPLGPMPAEGTVVELTRAHAGSTLFVAAFEPGVGGFRFPLRAVASHGAEVWTTEVCAADRKTLGGVGSMIAQLVVLEDPQKQPGVKSTAVVRGLAVFTAETHGVTVEVFDVDTGSRLVAWSSNLWSL